MNQSNLKIGLTCCAGILVCGIILFTGPEPLEVNPQEKKPVVSIKDLERTSFSNTVIAYGELLPRKSLELSTQVQGAISWVSDDLFPGARVKKDELLFSIDDRDYTNAVAIAEGRYAEAKAKVEIENGRFRVAQFERETFKEYYDKDLKDNSLVMRMPQRAEAEGYRKALGAELENAKLALERTKVRAPWPATVVQTNAILGKVMQEGEVAATLFPLDYAVIELQLPIKKKQLLNAGFNRIEIRPVYDLEASPVFGEIEGIVRNLTSDTRLLTVRVRIDDPLGNEGWFFGMHMEARLLTKQVISVAFIPENLLVSGNLVWIHRNGRAQLHQLYPVEVKDQTISVEDNFDIGDALIIERPIGLFDGAPVDVREI